MLRLKLSKVSKVVWGLIALLMVLTVYLYNSDPASGPIFPCLFNQLTGLHCPGCGMSRAFNAFLHFDLRQSIRYNALPYVLGPFAVIAFVRYIQNKPYGIWVGIMLAIAIGYGILRNLPHFYFLAPTAL